MRRDLADFFSTLVEGVKGKRAVEWKLVDAVHPTSQFKDAVQKRARELAAASDRPTIGPGIVLNPLTPTVTESSLAYSAVTMTINRDKRTADLTVHAPTGPQPSTPDEILNAGDQFWALRAFRELDDALLRLRANEPEIGTVVIRTTGDGAGVVAIDRTLLAHQSHWLVREIIHFMKRTLKRVDLTSRTFFAFIETGSAFAGSLFELALAADRSWGGQNSAAVRGAFQRHGIGVRGAGAVEPEMVAAFPAWAIWQFANDGSVPGIRGAVDLNWLVGGEKALQAFCRMPRTPAASPCRPSGEAVKYIDMMTGWPTPCTIPITAPTRKMAQVCVKTASIR